MLSILKRNFTLLQKTQSLNHLRNNPNNLTSEYVKNIKSLSLDEQEYLYHRMFLIFSTCITGFSYDDFKDYFNHLPGPYLKMVMLKEKKFNTDIAFTLYATDEVYLNENDLSKENLYISSYFANMVAPHYRGGDLGRIVYSLSNSKLRSEFPDKNRLSYNTTLNCRLYENRAEITPLLFPGPNPMPNDQPERLLQKIMKLHATEGISKDKPYIVFIPAAISGANLQKYKEEKVFKSKAREYFINETGLEYGQLLANIGIYNLIEGNTLGIKAGRYENQFETNVEIVDYNPKFS